VHQQRGEAGTRRAWRKDRGVDPIPPPPYVERGRWFKRKIENLLRADRHIPENRTYADAPGRNTNRHDESNPDHAENVSSTVQLMSATIPILAS
jgi:hypothetical protein